MLSKSAGSHRLRLRLLRAARCQLFSTQNVGVFALVEAYRRLGHLTADINPLGKRNKMNIPELGLDFHKLEPAYTISDELTSALRLSRKLSGSTVEALVDHLRNTYTGSIGAEFMCIDDVSERHWMIDEIEAISAIPISPGLQKNLLSLMYQSQLFDEFMQKKFRAFKRYGLEGAESFLVASYALFCNAAAGGIEDIVIGMPHRGRLNLLVALLDYPPRALFSKVKGASHTREEGHIGSDDVVSHIATSVTKSFGNQSPVHISLLHNPSHLEAVNPVALGKVKAIQDMNGDDSRKSSVCIQFHGDAAFSGQGVVTESLQLAYLEGFSTGGTIHVIVNNQIGYTTEPIDGRSGPYASDVASLLRCPVLHVNGEDPEAVYRASVVAIKYRKEFQKDIIIDLIAYRKHGHNEVDEPSFTQPSMYKNINSRISIAQQYAKNLESKGIKTESVLEKVSSNVSKFLEAELKHAEEFKPHPTWNFEGNWKGISQPSDMTIPVETGMDLELLIELGLKSVEVPDGFAVHPRLKKSHIAARKDVIYSGKQIDWATAEALAFGSLLKEGYNIRLSGQDVQRGTFSQRHAALVDQNTDEKYIPFCHLGDSYGKFSPVNSHLSEFGVLGFEFGYSWESPKNLNIWEAQFGDFWNTAQVIVDNFIASGEAKWIRQSGIVMLLPHGYDGAGPEHSTAKIERFLHLCDSDEFRADDKVVNMSVVNCSTPANYFHVLRRQMLRNFRKPLIVISPKTILRLPEATSSLDEFQSGTHFLPVIGSAEDDTVDKGIHRIIFCSGKFYYDLIKAKNQAENGNNIAICRLEELCPFPSDLIAAQLSRYNNVKEIVWAQEEPANGGAWSFVSPRLSKVLRRCGISQDLLYVGRKASASPVKISISAITV